jgi:flagellar basal-body rod protein FlgB
MDSLSPQIDRLARLATVLEMRQRVISHNLANANTPGFQALDVDFERHLAAAGGLERVAEIEPQVVLRQGLAERMDGNNVDVDMEIAQANKNSLLYQTYVQLLAGHFDSLRRAIGS